jgi:hypothetical protein
LKTANEAVRTLLSQRNDERMSQEKAALANARNVVDERYRDLVLMVNAAAAMEDETEGLEGVISQVNELIKYYRQYVAPKGSSTGSETGGNGGGSNTGGNGGGSSTGGNGGGSNTGGDSSAGSETGGGSNNGGGTSNGGSSAGSETGGGGNSGGGGDNGYDEPDQ